MTHVPTDAEQPAFLARMNQLRLHQIAMIRLMAARLAGQQTRYRGIR